MGKRQLIFHWINLHRGTWARMDLNGVPFYRIPFLGPHSRSGPINYLLKPGKNVLEIELLKTGKPNPYENETKHVNDAVKFQLYIVNNPDAGETVKLDRTMLLDVAYPDIWDKAEEKAQHFPFYHRQEFDLDYDLATPAFVDAPKAEFDCEGTPALRQAVQDLYAKLESQDYDALLDDLSFKFYCDERACEGEDGQRASVKMNQWRTEMFPYEPVPAEPLDMTMLHFEPCCEGRVAYVTRHDEGFPLDAVCRKDPKRRIRTDLYMMQHQGRWRVFA
jgi:hypothetical protein